MTAVYLGLGTNIGDRCENIGKALRMLSELVVLECVSSLYETEPIGYKDQPPFINAVCRVDTELKPHLLLDEIKTIESGMGRKPSLRNAPRVIDIDILLFNSLVINTEKLIIPHPRLHERAFVLVPLAEIAPCIIHPVLMKTVRTLLKSIDDSGLLQYKEAGKL